MLRFGKSDVSWRLRPDRGRITGHPETNIGVQICFNEVSQTEDCRNVTALDDYILSLKPKQASRTGYPTEADVPYFRGQVPIPRLPRFNKERQWSISSEKDGLIGLGVIAVALVTSA